MTSNNNGGPSSHETAAQIHHYTSTLIVAPGQVRDKLQAEAAARGLRLPDQIELDQVYSCTALDNRNETRGNVRVTAQGAELSLDGWYLCIKVQP